MDFSEDVGCQVVEALKEEVGNHVVTYLSVVVEVVVVLVVVVALVVDLEGENCGFFLFLKLTVATNIQEVVFCERRVVDSTRRNISERSVFRLRRQKWQCLCQVD